MAELPQRVVCAAPSRRISISSGSFAASVGQGSFARALESLEEVGREGFGLD